MNARRISRSIRKHASITLCSAGVGVMLCSPSAVTGMDGWLAVWVGAAAVVALTAPTAGRVLDTEARAKKIQSLKQISL